MTSPWHLVPSLMVNSALHMTEMACALSCWTLHKTTLVGVLAVEVASMATQLAAAFHILSICIYCHGSFDVVTRWCSIVCRVLWRDDQVWNEKNDGQERACTFISFCNLTDQPSWILSEDRSIRKGGMMDLDLQIWLSITKCVPKYTRLLLGEFSTP